METPNEMSILNEIRDVLHENPAIAKRAKFWADKYVEDRNKPKETKVRMVQEKLFGEFPELGRKGARFLAQKATRDW